ncbi:LPXTG cell wall anchor domain-containing protein [Candidatus Palauibacter sp.]
MNRIAPAFKTAFSVAALSLLLSGAALLVSQRRRKRPDVRDLPLH